MTTLTHVPTLQGSTALMGRVATSSQYEIKNWTTINNNPFATDTQKGCALGHVIQAVF